MSDKVRICYASCGYIDSLIGGFVLVAQGILTIIGQGVNSLATTFGSMSILSSIVDAWINGLIMLVLGLLVLFLVWKWLQDKIGSGSIDNWIMLGILLIILGIVAGGVGGTLVLIGGILYLIGGIKSN